MTWLAFGLGANMGSRDEALASAKAALEHHFHTNFIASPIYESDPWGIKDQPKYLNQVIAAEIKGLSYADILGAIRSTEAALEKEGRHMLSRTIDVDALFYGSHIIQCPTITLPHPRLKLRRFVLQPLHDLDITWHHPMSGRSIPEMLDNCRDHSALNRC